MHWLLFIHKIIFSSTCFEPQMLIFRRIQLYTCSIWYCHSLWEFLVVCRYTAWVKTHYGGRNSHREWQYHTLHMYNCILLKMSTWGSKHIEENSILWINNNQCIKSWWLMYRHLKKLQCHNTVCKTRRWRAVVLLHLYKIIALQIL